MPTSTKRGAWIVVWLLIAIAGTAFGIVQFTQGAGLPATPEPILAHFSQSDRARAAAGLYPRVDELSVLPDTQVFYSDLVVRSGDRYDGDVAVYTGDVRLEGGGTIAGSLYVFNGNVTQEAGGKVGGELIIYSGDAVIAGSVGGALQCLSGNVDLQDAARIGGDVTILGGKVTRAPGAYIGGRVLSGPHLSLPVLPGLPNGQGQTVPTPRSPESQGQGNGRAPTNGVGPNSLGQAFVGRLLGFIMNLMQAALVTMAITLLAGMLVLVRQETVIGVATTMGDQSPLSFAVGFGIHILTALPVGLLAITWLAWPISLCLTPFSLPVGLLALGLQGVGWTATGLFIGRRLAQWLGFPWGPVPATMVGVIVITGGASLFWLLNPILGVVVAMLGGATGVGALLVRWRGRGPDALGRADEPLPAGSS